MSSLDEQDIFGSGPHSFFVEGWRRATQRRGFAGLDGELVLDQGRRSRVITQTGRLQASSAATLAALLEQIEALADGEVHVLVDGHDRTYQRVLVEEFKPQTPLQRGRGYWCDYTIRYRQLP